MSSCSYCISIETRLEKFLVYDFKNAKQVCTRLTLNFFSLALFCLFTQSLIVFMVHPLCYLLLAEVVCALNLPGNAPREYKQGDDVDLKVSKLTSEIYQVPYEYYYLNFCPPENGIAESTDESLGQILLGEALVNTPYKVRFSLLICSTS